MNETFVRYPHCDFHGRIDVYSVSYETHRYLLAGIYVILGVFTIFPNLLMLRLIGRHPLNTHSCFKILTLIGIIDLANLILACPISSFLSLFEATHCKYGNVITLIGYVTMITWTCSSASHLIMAINRLLEVANKRLGQKLFFGIKSCLWAAPVLLYGCVLNTFAQNPYYVYDPHGGGWIYLVIVGKDGDKRLSQNNLILLINNVGISFILIFLYVILILFVYKNRRKMDRRANRLQLKVTQQTIASGILFIIVMIVSLYNKTGLSKTSSKHALMLMHLAWIAVHGSTAYIVLITNPYVKRQLLKLLCFKRAPVSVATATPISFTF
ncbi:hypothetical protein L596_022403 [Steinernema carpocapsae]|uniref:G-protein coupled receptors family 1 profile domain-containing protein n=1 Tax=Steinernema carpocapsae TaxID=34508 RepID=A0A4U5MLL0_STECR|nr:hypothetical protein L596_022403 [Steinernema carpocapsae]